MAAYLFRATAGDFILEAANAEARQRSPGLASVIGRYCSQLYSDQPQMQEAARRCLREPRTIVQEIPVRRHFQMEATQSQTLVYLCVAPDLLVIFGRRKSQ